MKWQNKLTKKELKHIKDTTDSNTLLSFKANREHQLRLKEKDGREPCWECRFIAEKLGLEQ